MGWITDLIAAGRVVQGQASPATLTEGGRNYLASAIASGKAPPELAVSAGLTEGELIAGAQHAAHPGGRGDFLAGLATVVAFVPVVGQIAAVALGAAAKSEKASEAEEASLVPQNLAAAQFALAAAASKEQPMFDANGITFDNILTTGANFLTNLLQIKAQQNTGTSLPAMAMTAALPQIGSLPQIALGALPRIGSAITGAIAGAAGLVRTAAGRVRGVMLSSGRFISSKKGVALAKRVGIDAAAAALGITAVEMAQMVLDQGSAPRRGRGVTAAQIKTTKRTMRTVMGLHRQIVAACSSARVPMRKRAVIGGQVVFAKRCK